MKRISFILESLAGLALLWLINLLFYKENPGFNGVAPHPYLYLVVLITLRYGYLRGMFSLLAATASYLLALTAAGIPAGSAWLSPLATFVIFTTITGLITDNYRRRLERAGQNTASLNAVAAQLKTDRDNFEAKNQELSGRLMSEKSTFAILYRAACRLSTLDPDKLLDGIINLVDNVIEGDNCAIYLLAGHKLILKKAKDPQSLQTLAPDQEIVEQVINAKKTFSIKDRLSRNQQSGEDVFLCGPLLQGSGGTAAGIILVQGLDFLKYNPTTVRVFSLICDWASRCLENVMQYKTKQSSAEEMALAADAEPGKGFNGLFPWGTESSQIEERLARVCQNL